MALGIKPAEYSSQHVAIILNAFAKAGLQDDALFDLFSREIQKRDHRAFDMQAIANILNAYARNYGPSADSGVYKHMSKIGEKNVLSAECDTKKVSIFDTLKKCVICFSRAIWSVQKMYCLLNVIRKKKCQIFDTLKKCVVCFSRAILERQPTCYTRECCLYSGKCCLSLIIKCRIAIQVGLSVLMTRKKSGQRHSNMLKSTYALRRAHNDPNFFCVTRCENTSKPFQARPTGDITLIA